MTETNFRNYSIILLGMFLICAVVFSAFPEIDIYIAALFWRPDAGFWIADIEWVGLLRKGLLRLMTAVFLASTAAWIISLAWRPVFGVAARAWAFSTLLFLIGPGVIVNVVLKENWGRARPKDIGEFGGDREFTAPLDITDQCVQNCSFVSGEGAGAAAMALALLVLTRGLRNRGIAAFLMSVTWPLALTATALRVVMGRHFLSDTLFSVLIVASVALILVRPLKVDLR